MFTRLIAALMLMLLGTSMAFAQGKAYAPEDLNRLNRQDQVRVLEREYQDQANGAPIPNDQLEFYLDQIGSGWTFSRIKQDIAESLGGGGGWQPGPRPGPVAVFHCESRRKFGYGECRTPFQGRAQLQRQTSRTMCIEGRTWGSQPGLVWVNSGCEGDFIQAPRGVESNYSVTCGSRNYGYSSCAWRRQYGTPRILEQISREPCVQGRSWGYDRGRAGLWVDRGCEARFGTGY